MDFKSVEGKVAIVTGASRGIGEAIARCYAANGMKVICAARSVEQGQAVVTILSTMEGTQFLFRQIVVTEMRLKIS